MQNPVPENKNAAAAAALTGPAVLIVWAAGHLGVDLGAEEAVVIGGGLITIVLFIGSEGIVGVARRIWRGKGAASGG